MKKILLSLFTLFSLHAAAEDGHQLWLRYQPVHLANVSCDLQSPTIDIVRQELQTYYKGRDITLRLDASMPDDDGFRFDGTTLTAHHEAGLLYGAYALLRGEDKESHPVFPLRLLNHWDNLDGSIERGYAGESIFEWFHLDEQLIRDYARANASLGINGSVLNNVNASPNMLTTHPLDKSVARWWKKKAKEIYKLIPDFGGFLVKANSEGQPGPGDFGRTHADGANMLADAMKPYGGIIMWRCFVYGANHKGEDRVKQAVSEFKPLDGLFRDNVILQTKNGPLDFQPREPYSPIFDQIKQTPNMVELQITQEYLGQSRHLVYLAPMNIGKDRNWCGHHFSQANWYAFGRLAWCPDLSSEKIAEEWLEQTFTSDKRFVDKMTMLMEMSREACVKYMMPLGLHHIFKFDHHYGPEPDGFIASYPLEWCPVYYHKANKDSIGFDRSHTGTNATSQYRKEIADRYDNIETCPEDLLLWFHRVPWTYRMKDGSTLWESLQFEYQLGVIMVETMQATWHNKMRHYVDEQRWREVDERLADQLQNAREWRDVCLGYFRQFAE